MRTSVDTKPAVWRRLCPVPWRDVIAGSTASGLVILIVNGMFEDDQLLAFLAMPVLLGLWAITAASLLRGLRADHVLAVTVVGGIVGAAWTLDIPYDAGSTGWNVAVLVGGTCGVALTEWTFNSPAKEKWAAAAIALVLGMMLVDQVSDHVDEQRIDQVTVQQPTR